MHLMILSQHEAIIVKTLVFCNAMIVPITRIPVYNDSNNSESFDPTWSVYFAWDPFKIIFEKANMLS